MFDKLKQFATEQLNEKMAQNSLDINATKEAATDGADAILNSIKERLSGGADGLEQVKELFSGKIDNLDANDIFANAKEKFSSILQDKGMDAQEATSEATAKVTEMINSFKDRFDSNDDADKDFDLGNIANAVTDQLGDLGGLMDKAKGLFGK